MRKKWIYILGFLIIIILTLLIVFIMGVSQYNRIIILNKNTKDAWKDVDIQLKRRNDLIPDFINKTKGYLKHEKEIFAYITEARSRFENTTEIEEKIRAAQELDNFFGRLLFAMEYYLSLKKDLALSQLINELITIENRITLEMHRYNELVELYNTTIQRFPGAILASSFNFKRGIYYKNQKTAGWVQH